MWATIKIILQFLPELVKLIKTITGWVEEGIEEMIIRKRLKGIDHAIKIKNPNDRARALNDVFRS